MKPSRSLPLRIRAHLAHGDTPQPRAAVQVPIQAAYYRGGTSRAVFFQPQHLPQDRSKWPHIFRQTMGSGDPYGRQLDGMGAGISSLSKICLVEPYGKRKLVAKQAIAERVQNQTLDGARDLLEKVRARGDAVDGIDIDYTFVGLGIEDHEVDVAGNCGNMSSAIGPYAYNAGLLPPRVYAKGNGEVSVRIRNTNTGKIINASFQVAGGQAAVVGDYTIDGVTGSASKIKLDFEQPYGSKTGKVLPTGNRTDRILGYKVSCVDGANPCIFIRASDVGVDGTILPNDFNRLPDKLALLESIRKAAAVAMGIAPTEDAVPRTIPKIGLVSMSSEHLVLSGQTLQSSQTDLVIRFLSDTQPHRAIPLTAALTTAVAARIPGTLVEQLLSPDPVVEGAITIGHASGRLQVDATMDEKDGITPINATVYRTAKRLFEGTTYWLDDAPAKHEETPPPRAHGSNGTHSLGMAFVLESRGQSTESLFASETTDDPEQPQTSPDPLEELGFTKVRKYTSTSKKNTVSQPQTPPSPENQTTIEPPLSPTTAPQPSPEKGREWHQWAKTLAKHKKALREHTKAREEKDARRAAGVRPTTMEEFGLDKYGRPYAQLKAKRERRERRRSAEADAEVEAETRAEVEAEARSAESLVPAHDLGPTSEDKDTLMREAVDRDRAREARWARLESHWKDG